MARRSNAAVGDASTGAATGVGFIHGLSVVEELEALLAHLGELEPVDEADDFAETAVHVRLLPSDLAHAEGRALPVIVVGAFRDRDVELVLYARLDRPQHTALALERVILGEQQLEPEHADHHGPGAARVRPCARPPARLWPRRGRARGPPARPRRPRSRRPPSRPGSPPTTCPTRSRPPPPARPLLSA